MAKRSAHRRRHPAPDPPPGATRGAPSSAVDHPLENLVLRSWIFSSRTWPWLGSLLVLVLVTWAYWPALRSEFTNYDDPDYVTSNIHVRQGLTAANVVWAFRSTDAANWHPVTWLSHMLDGQLFGLRPRYHHLTNLLLHEVNTLLIFLLLRKLTGAVGRSLVVAGLFGLHPLHVESVAWVAERKDVLSGLFFFLTLLAYAAYVDKSRPGTDGTSPHASRIPLHARFYYALALLLFALGLMSKPMLVTLPFVLLLLDYWPLERNKIRNPKAEGRKKSEIREPKDPATTMDSPFGFRISLRLLLEKAPFFVLSALASFVTYHVQSRAGAVQVSAVLPFSERLANAAVAYSRYLGKLFYPVKLAVFYPHPVHWPTGTIWLSLLALVAITVLMLVWRRRYPYGLVGWLWFLGMLVPVLGLVQVGAQAMADRYAYLPLLGPFIAISWGISDLAISLNKARLSRQQVNPAQSEAQPSLADAPAPAGSRLLWLAAAPVLLVCAGLTQQQARYWHDSGTLFRHALAVTEKNAVSYLQLGMYTLTQRGQLDEALDQLKEAVHLKPDYAQAHNALGTAFEKKNQLEEAVGEFEQAMKLYPALVEAQGNLGAALYRAGRMPEARAQLEEAIARKPDYAPAHNHLGSVLQAAGHLDQAVAEFGQAIRFNPYYADAYNNLGIALGMRGQGDEAVAAFEEAIQLRPDYTPAYNNLGHALWEKGRREEAVRWFEAAVRRDPTSARAHGNLGVALAGCGRREEALHHLNEALKLQPYYPEAQQQLLKLTQGQ